MFDSSSYDNPAPLAHADTSRDVLPRGDTSQTVHSKDRTITIKSLYHPPNSQHLDTNMMEVKRSNWQNLCEKLDYRTSNTKLWKLAKQIDNLKPRDEEANAIISDNSYVSVDAREAKEALIQHYANESRLTFSSSDKHLARVTRDQIKSCRDKSADNPLFNVDFTLPELSYALQNLDTNKSSGPDNIPEHLLSHLGILDSERLLYICNLSWKTEKLPRQWKSAIVIPIHKPNKNACLTTSYHPISFTFITCKLMDCMVQRRLTHHLHTNNLMPTEQFAFRKGHSTVDQTLYFTQCVRDSQNHKPTRRTMEAFLDVSKAFNREAGIQPLTIRFEVNSYRYFNKIKSFGSFNRTSSFILNWTSNQRLRRDSPLNYMRKHGFIDFNVDASTPFSCITPMDSFNHVEFREELLTSTHKHSSHPELLRQLALEVINDILDQTLIIDTDGSRSDTGRAGSGIFSNTPGNDVKISIRNPDHCSVFRSKLIAISGALEHALNSYMDNIWIMTDSRSSIPYLKNWPIIMDSTGLDILCKLVRLGQRKQVCLQWIPSHVGVPGNEAADELAGRGSDLPNPRSTVLTHTEIHSFQRNKMNLTCQMNSLAASVTLTYSASMVDRLTDFCLKVRHEIGVSSIKVMNPPIDTRSSLFVAKSESE
ncbi:putative RNA-directed DNA polymerase from transposon BS [Trichonephila clavipes]|nr:putative RNA-directed DNA polymerase from transposon BS [Trichonephila clavipes]